MIFRIRLRARVVLPKLGLAVAAQHPGRRRLANAYKPVPRPTEASRLLSRPCQALLKTPTAVRDGIVRNAMVTTKRPKKWRSEMPSAMTMPMAVEIDAAIQKYAAGRASDERKLDMNPTKASTTPPNSAENISGSNVHHILSRGANSDGGAITPSKTPSIRAS